MKLRSILPAVGVYTGLAGAITVAAVYFGSHSGPYILATGGIGLLFVVLGGADSSGLPTTTGPTMGTGKVSSEEMGLQDLPVRPTPGNHSTHLILILYGLGLFLWSGVVVAFFRSGLH